MIASSWFSRKPARPQKSRPRLPVEQLEDRSVPAPYTAATVPELIADINLANQTAEADTIELVAGATFTLTQVNNTNHGPTGLPTIEASGGALTIQGNGDTIERRQDVIPLIFVRFFDVAMGASLTLSQVTLQGGQGVPSGGAIYSEGTVVLDGVTVQGNQAWSNNANSIGAGGGIWSSGTLTLRNGTVISNNSATGASATGNQGVGGDAFGGGIWSSGILMVEDGTRIDHNLARGGSGGFDTNGSGGNGYGGGLYLAGGTADLTGATIISNGAEGGSGAITEKTVHKYPYTYYIVTGAGGDGYGGGLYVAGGSSVTMQGDSVQSNGAYGGRGIGNRNSSKGFGGGVFIVPEAVLYLDAFTLANVINNTDASGTNGKTANIYGSYTLIT